MMDESDEFGIYDDDPPNFLWWLGAGFLGLVFWASVIWTVGFFMGWW